jgi:hypothetical protein
LQERLARVVVEDADNPVTGLPANYRITIFSLRPSSARRARDILLGRNPELDVRICMETDINQQAKALARHSDLVVVVTTAITHALTYGIGPYVRDPIFANAAGSTSIIDAIEKRLKQSAAVAG